MKKIQPAENLQIGLTKAQAEAQARLGKVNIIPDKAAKTGKEIIKENVFTYFNGIFLLIALLLIIAGSFRSLTFLPIVIANTIIGIVQQLRAKKILDDLAVLSVSECSAFRDGRRKKVPVNELVLGDAVLLESGQQIPADAVVLDGTVMVNEALLTGESDEIEKTQGSELKSGSFVVSGQCLARLTRVGEDSYVARLTAQAKKITDKQSEMVRAIDLIVKIAGIIIIPLGILLFYQSFFINDNSFSDSIVSTVGALIGMIPEGLYLLVTISIALSAARLARVSVLLHDMRSTEALARVDVLCVDKTGTITTNEMDVTDVFAAEGQLEYFDQNERLLAGYVHAMTDRNITMKALNRYFPDDISFPSLKIQPFSSRNKYSQITTKDRVYRLGAPEFLLGEKSFSLNQEKIEEYTGKGDRVLAFVRADRPDGTFYPLLFVSLKNGIRPNVADTFAYLQEQEVAIRVISGDNPVTVSKIAMSVGIADADKYVDASTLCSPEDIRQAVEKYTVFGRVNPDQKKQLILAYREAGKKVAMTGDGVNDILAMKEADCSIAMGAGCDAAMQSAQVVLLDSDFSRMKNIISEGRRDINNITRSATLFLYKNIFSMLLAIFSIINVFTYPLQPSQVSLISMFNIGIPAFALAMEANERKQSSHFMREVLHKSLPAALTSFVSIAALMVFGQVFHISESDVGTASTVLLAFVGFMILRQICRPMNLYRSIVFVVSLIGMIFCAIFFSELFAIEHISTSCLMLAVVFLIAEESLMRNLTILGDHIRSWIETFEKGLRSND